MQVGCKEGRERRENRDSAASRKGLGGKLVELLSPGTTAPEESFTKPRMVPVFCCAVAVTASISRRVAAAMHILLFIIPPFS